MRSIMSEKCRYNERKFPILEYLYENKSATEEEIIFDCCLYGNENPECLFRTLMFHDGPEPHGYITNGYIEQFRSDNTKKFRLTKDGERLFKMMLERLNDDEYKPLYLKRTNNPSGKGGFGDRMRKKHEPDQDSISKTRCPGDLTYY